MRTFVGLIGVVVTLVSAFFVAAFVMELAVGGDEKTSAGVYVGLTVFFGLALVGGAWLAWSRLWRTPGRVASYPRRLTDAEREQRILDLAEREGGRVTIPEVAAHCDMTVDESKVALDRLVVTGVADLCVSDAGILVYAFSGFLSDEEKARATDF